MKADASLQINAARTPRLPAWFRLFALGAGVYVLLPFLAPAFMAGGWSGAGRTIYFIYSFLCHQLPERSFFLFGPRFTYALPEIQAAFQNTTNPMILRQFTGNTALGWKVAWSDRMVSMFTSMWVFGLLWYPLRRRLPRLPLWALGLLLLPMAVDGASHFISDFQGIGQGFRDTNLWLAALTNHSLASSFYAGDAWGSFNSGMRLLSGILFGLGIIWFSFPYIDEAF
ncbi:MAG TPA: DUF2085 domain-containing protein [Anaerolineales bacterium]|jgi:hypothetical protein